MSELHERLKRETAELHAAVEARVDLVSPDLTRSRYVELLGRLRALHAGLEPAIAAALGEGDPVEPWRRLGYLDRDLAHFGSRPGSDVAAAEMPVLRSADDALGALYVLEGSRLGGRLIARGLERTLGLSSGEGYGYFDPPGRPTGAAWRALKERLGAHRGDADRVVAAARATFASFASAFEAAGREVAA